MERVLLLASVIVGLVVFLCRLLPAPRAASSATPPPEEAGDGGVHRLHPALRAAALAAPLLGLLVTLPAGGALFAPGQRLGSGFLLGGAGALLCALPLLRGRRDTAPAPVALAGNVGVAAAAVALALLTLRASVLDGLMGVAVGWFCSAFALLLALPATERARTAGRSLVAGAGAAAALAAAAALGVFRDPLTPHLAKLTWSAALTAFAAFGALLVAGASLVPMSGARARTLPLFALVLGGGLALWLAGARPAAEPRLLYAGLGGLLLWPIAVAVLRDGLAKGRTVNPTTPAFAVPALAMLTVTAGFLASLQALQGVGAGAFVMAVWLAAAAMAAEAPPAPNNGGARGEDAVPHGIHSPHYWGAGGAISLALFSTVLLLWRLFVTRWAGEMRGVTLSDQYALFGLLVGAALPSLLAAVPERWQGRGAAGAGIVTLAWCAGLALAAPGAALLLFGPKMAAALLIGLALGSILAAPGRAPSMIAGSLALAVALALDQFGGKVLSAMGDDMTRPERLRWLVGVMAAVAVLVVAGDRTVASAAAAADEEEA